jgi:hypothetical protein
LGGKEYIVANVDKLLHGVSGVDLLSQLDLRASEDALLKSAKRKIREHLRRSSAPRRSGA